MVGERWKRIEGSDDCFVSNYGNVKRGRSEGRMVDIQQDSEGYFRCSVGGMRGRDRVHRFVAEAFVKNDSPGIKTQVDHIDGDKQNNNADNLRWVTSRENTVAAGNNGLLKHGGSKTPLIGIEISKSNVMLFKSQADATKHIGAREDGCEVNKVLNGKRYTTHGWYFCKLSDESIGNIKQVISQL